MLVHFPCVNLVLSILTMQLLCGHDKICTGRGNDHEVEVFKAGFFSIILDTYLKYYYPLAHQLSMETSPHVSLLELQKAELFEMSIKLKLLAPPTSLPGNSYGKITIQEK